jgi:cytochrome c-type biogenesis protein
MPPMPPVLVFAFVAGLLTIVAPCTLPVVPFVLGTGTTGRRRRPLGIALGFGATFVLVAVLLASLLAAAGLTTSQLRVTRSRSARRSASSGRRAPGR